MSLQTPDTLIGQLADSGAEITLSLRRVLTGYVTEWGGPEELGREMARLSKDPEVSIASRVALVNNVAKLLGSFGDQESKNDLLDDEQIEARIRQLDSNAMQDEEE